MNFKRIQWIFVIAFAIFDIVLASYFLIGTHFTAMVKQQSQQQLILKEMHNDEISFAELSTKQPMGYYISANRANSQLTNAAAKLDDQTVRLSNGTLISELNTPIKVSVLNPERQLNDYIKNSRHVLYGSHYVYNKALSSSSTIVYTQMMEGRPVLGSEGQLRFKIGRNHKVYAYTQTYLNNIQVLRPRSVTISQQEAVTWLYKHNYIPNNSKIHCAKLGYTKTLLTKDQTVYVPTWYVEIKTKNSDDVQRLRVNAFNSTLMRNTPEEIDTTQLNQ
ncbi:two-component system regulatory protein YycI [Limosilactobacillus mucosae]|jgi:regulatory protein YycI of two-component signal transduction system YycFG|uniref:two-component system regulatory protein YycI n=1 Tax=Limosilactobacillus mucosae TaxID=97478 RepID=UPI00399559A8